MPSNDKSDKDWQCSSFSQPSIEKSDSTVAVFACTVAIPPQKSCKTSNRPWTIFQLLSNDIDVLPVWQLSSAILRMESYWYARQSWRCCCSILLMVSSLHEWRSYWRCLSTMVLPNSAIRSLTSSCGKTGGRSSAVRLRLSHSAWISWIPSITVTRSLPTW